MAEFALVLPVLMMVVMLGLDLGRAFFSWVTVSNAARIGANYAGLNPDPTFAKYATNAAAGSYDGLISGDGANAACVITRPNGAPPQPVFADTALDANSTVYDLGDTATVTVSCPFRLLTPIVGAITGNQITISAGATFTIRNGAFNP